jgi:hypothetical protein
MALRISSHSTRADVWAATYDQTSPIAYCARLASLQFMSNSGLQFLVEEKLLMLIKQSNSDDDELPNGEDQFLHDCWLCKKNGKQEIKASERASCLGLVTYCVCILSHTRNDLCSKLAKQMGYRPNTLHTTH